MTKFLSKIIFNNVALVIVIIICSFISGSLIFSRIHQDNIYIDKYQKDNSMCIELFYMADNKRLEQFLSNDEIKDSMMTADSPFYDQIQNFHITNNKIKLFRYDLMHKYITKDILKSLKNYKYMYSVRTKNAIKKRKKDIFNLCCIEVYITFLVALIIISFIFYINQRYIIVNQLSFNDKAQNDVTRCKNNLKHQLAKNVISNVVDKFMFNIIPIIISVSSGIVIFVASSNIFYYLAEFSVPIFSLIQFYRIYKDYIYLIKDTNKSSKREWGTN